MRPPPGFRSDENPLLHRLPYSFGLSFKDETANTAFCSIVRHTNDVIANTPSTIVVNPRNTNVVEDFGAAVAKMSIIHRLRISIKFNLTAHAASAHHVSGTSTNEVFRGDDIQALHLLWRPIFGSFPEKLDAADDDTGTTVAAILGLTKDATFEDVVPITTNDLPVAGGSELDQPASTVNIAEVFGDFNMTTDLKMEDHVYNENLLHTALRRYTNKGALRACLGRTRHLTLSRNHTYQNYYLDKFVPRAIRRVMPYTFFGIQVHVPLVADMGQEYSANTVTGSVAHVGCKILANYHEWNSDHFQNRTGTAPVPV